MQIPLSNHRAQLVAGRVRALDRALGLEAPTPVLLLTYFSDRLVLTVRTINNVALTLYSSDASIDVFRTNLSKQFPSSAARTSFLNTNRRTIDLLTIDTVGLTSLNGPIGTADMSAFPNLVGCSLQNSMCNVFIIDILYALAIDGAQCAGKALDISEVNASQVLARNTLANAVNWPVAGVGILNIYVDSHALTGPQTLPPLPALQVLSLSNNQAASSQKIGLLDVRQVPTLAHLGLRQARVDDLLVAVGGQLGYLDIIYSDFSQGRVGAVLEAFQRSPNLTRIDGYNCGLDAETLEAFLDYLLSSQRTATLVFGGGGTGFHYLDPPTSSGRACEPLVSARAQAKLARVRAAGTYLEINDPVFRATVLDETTCRLELVNSTKLFDLWQVGDVLTCTQPFNGDLFNYGDHTVLSGAGNTWVVTNTKNYQGFIGAGGNSLLHKK